MPTTILLNLTDDTIRRVFAGSDDFAVLRPLGNVIRFDPKAAEDAARFADLVARADVVLTGWGSRKIAPEEVAGLTAFLLGPDGGSVTGQQIVMCGGASL